MELESWGQPARGLREYLRQVAAACGSGEVFSVRWERPLTGYVPLEKRVAAAPELDVALVWDERTGWRSVLEPATNDLITLSYLDGPVCPPPEEVAEFAADPGAGSATPTAKAGADVLDLLSEYAVVWLHPLMG
jgi:hypothetical protein